MTSGSKVPLWMIFLGSIALIGVSAGIFLVVVSGKNRHALVQSDYYAEGLKLDEHRAAEVAFDSLGFTLTLRQESGALVVEAAGPGGAEAELRAQLSSHDLVLQLRIMFGGLLILPGGFAGLDFARLELVLEVLNLIPQLLVFKIDTSQALVGFKLLYDFLARL